MRLLRFPLARTALVGVSLALAAPVFGPMHEAAARAAPDSFADLASKLLPAVVNVSSTQTITARPT